MERESAPASGELRGRGNRKAWFPMRDDSSIREIPLTHGRVALVDAHDYDFLSVFKWHLNWHGYAVREVNIHGFRTLVGMHRYVMLPDPGQDTDHVNGDKLDNRRSNLRTCHRQENTRNVDKRSGGTSRFKGVHWHPGAQKWRAMICVNKRSIHIGYFSTQEEAAVAYNEKARELFREYARPNILESVT
jgi:hypothetical protein